MQSDVEIAQKAKMKKISDIATHIGKADEYNEPYGHYKSKIALEYRDQLHDKPNGKLILVRAISPTLGDAVNLTKIPSAEKIDVNEAGDVVGLF